MKDETLPILLVDDDEVDVMSVKRAFRRLQIANPLFVAHNGFEALQMLRGEHTNKALPSRPAVILLDLNMPRMGGLEFLHVIRSDDTLKSLVIIILTTSNDNGDKKAAYDYNVAGYLVKPVIGADFMETIATFKQYWSINELPPSVQ